jgi:NAD-dependent DNA ligase
MKSKTITGALGNGAKRTGGSIVITKAGQTIPEILEEVERVNGEPKSKWYLLVWTSVHLDEATGEKTFTDHFHTFQDCLKSAEIFFEEVRLRDNTYTANIAEVIKSTDY